MWRSFFLAKRSRALPQLSHTWKGSCRREIGRGRGMGGMVRSGEMELRWEKKWQDGIKRWQGEGEGCIKSHRKDGREGGKGKGRGLGEMHGEWGENYFNLMGLTCTGTHNSHELKAFLALQEHPVIKCSSHSTNQVTAFLNTWHYNILCIHIKGEFDWSPLEPIRLLGSYRMKDIIN